MGESFRQVATVAAFVIPGLGLVGILTIWLADAALERARKGRERTRLDHLDFEREKRRELRE